MKQSMWSDSQPAWWHKFWIAALVVVLTLLPLARPPLGGNAAHPSHQASAQHQPGLNAIPVDTADFDFILVSGLGLSLVTVARRRRAVTQFAPTREDHPVFLIRPPISL